MKLQKLTEWRRSDEKRRYDDACAAAHGMDLIGERWSMPLIRELLLGPRRFSDLKTSLNGISANVLTQRLEGLEAAGVLVRRKLPPLVTGAYQPIAAQGDILLYRRDSGDESVAVALNFGAEPVSIACKSIGFGHEILLSTSLDRQGEAVQGALDLRGKEGVILGSSA